MLFSSKRIKCILLQKFKPSRWGNGNGWIKSTKKNDSTWATTATTSADAYPRNGTWQQQCKWHKDVSNSFLYFIIILILKTPIAFLHRITAGANGVQTPSQMPTGM